MYSLLIFELAWLVEVLYISSSKNIWLRIPHLLATRIWIVGFDVTKESGPNKVKRF